MDRENVISGLKYTAEMFLFDPATGYTKDPDDLNAADRITFDTCIGAIDLLKEQDAQSVLSNRVCESEPFRYVRKGFCPKCHQEMEWLFNRNYCGFCGQAVKWN